MDQTELVVKNYRRFQHYRDRNPPWIKLHTQLLTDPEFVALRDAARYHLVALWIVASRSDGVLPDDAAVLGRLIGASEQVNLDELVSSGFLIRRRKRRDSTVDASGEQPASEVLCSENRGQNYFDSTIRRGRARERFAEEDQQAVDAFLDSLPDHQVPAWEARISGYLQGLDFPGGRAATPGAIGTACRDLAGEQSVSPARFRRYVERAMVDAQDSIAGRRERNASRWDDEVTPEQVKAIEARLRAKEATT